jgi:hypothetical protein
MAASTPSIDEICAQAALRNVALRQATKQASDTLTTALRLVTGSTEVPEEFLPRIASPAPKLEELLELIAPPEPVVEAKPVAPEKAISVTPTAPSATPVVQAQPLPDKKIAFEPVTWPTLGAAPAVKPPPASAPTPAKPSAPPTPKLGPNEIYFPAGELLFNKGDAADRFYVIRQGEVALFEPSTQKHIATLGPGTSFGEQAILVGGVRSVSARAVDGVICLALSAETLREMLEVEQGTIKPVFEALLLQLYLHNDLHARGHRYNA